MAVSPVTPVMVAGPAAESVQSVAVAVAPVVPLSTTLTNVNSGAIAVLVIVHVADSPSTNVTELSVEVAAPVHTHPDGV